jgi:hypothetical protein
VVLAQGVHRDVAGEDELVVVLVVGKGGEVEVAGREQLGVRRSDASRCVAQVCARGVLAQRLEQVGDRPLGRVEVDVAAAVGDPEPRLRLRAHGATDPEASSRMRALCRRAIVVSESMRERGSP